MKLNYSVSNKKSHAQLDIDIEDIDKDPGLDFN